MNPNFTLLSRRLGALLLRSFESAFIGSLKLLAFPIGALLFCQTASACESSIAGAWRSDGAKTMAFARDNTKLEPRQDSFLAALMGHMIIEFDEKNMRLRLPDLEVPVNGETMPFAGFSEERTYKILFCNDQKSVVQSTLASGKNDVTTYFFVGTDEMWVYAGSSDPTSPDMHLREYFRREPALRSKQQSLINLTPRSCPYPCDSPAI